MTTKERQVLNSFLAEGLTHREVDLTLGLNPARSRGWYSFRVLTKGFGITGVDRGTLFLYPRQEVRRVITAISDARSRAPLDRMLPRLKPPNVLEPYRDTFVLARGAIALQKMLSGEARNAVQRFFESRKTAMGRCQMHGCRERLKLDTVHLLRTRPVLFIRAAREHGTADNRGVMYDVYATMKSFLEAHMGIRPIAFLCQPHHQLVDELRANNPETYRAFIRTLASGFHAGKSS